MTMLHLIVTIFAVVAATAPAQHSHDEMKHRGGLAMGFDQDKTTHHFLLQDRGGEIVVTAKDPADTGSIAKIRSHFREIATSFAAGAFDKPVATHGELPPGAAVMTANARLIRYRYQERAGGASVVIETADAATREAIHDFLRYQITEHKTGDPLTPRREPAR
jgi:hypothetical protein